MNCLKPCLVMSCDVVKGATCAAGITLQHSLGCLPGYSMSFWIVMTWKRLEHV